MSVSYMSDKKIHDLLENRSKLSLLIIIKNVKNNFIINNILFSTQFALFNFNIPAYKSSNNKEQNHGSISRS